MLLVFMSTPPEHAVVCALMKNRRFKRWIVRHHCCRCSPVKLNDARMITNDMERLPCLRPLMFRLDAFSVKHTGATDPIEFRKFLDHVDSQVPTELDVHIIMDNYGT